MTAAPAHVLLTNDDGVTAEGLNALRDALIDLGAQVTVIAPDSSAAAWRERSPFAAALPARLVGAARPRPLPYRLRRRMGSPREDLGHRLKS